MAAVGEDSGEAVLAPMVRLGTLPLRLLALERGAALVYSEEIIDAKLAGSTRTVDARLQTTDWRAGAGIVLRTCEAERGRLVVQLGTADVEGALSAIAALSFDDSDPLRDGIVGIDINMGCPKSSAMAGGSGSALFADAQRAERVVRAVRGALPAAIRLSCKVRLHELGPAETLRRCTGLVAAGASSIAIHARRAEERSCDLARWSELAAVARGLRECGATVLLNGDVLDAVAASQLRKEVPNCRLMIGRGALLAGIRPARSLLPADCHADGQAQYPYPDPARNRIVRSIRRHWSVSRDSRRRDNGVQRRGEC